MFPLTPDQHHWLDVATEDEGWCSFRSCRSCNMLSGMLNRTISYHTLIHLFCRCTVQTLENTSVTTSTMADGSMSTECVTPYASFFLMDIDTARNWLRQFWNGCGSCWRCCQSTALSDSTQAHCLSCMMAKMAERVLRHRLARELRQLLTITYWWDGRRILQRLLAAEVYTTRRWHLRLYIHMSTFEWLTLLTRHITASCRTKRLTLDQTTGISSALRTWSTCLTMNCTVQTPAKRALWPLMNAVLQCCKFVKLRSVF